MQLKEMGCARQTQGSAHHSLQLAHPNITVADPVGVVLQHEWQPIALLERANHNLSPNNAF